MMEEKMEKNDNWKDNCYNNCPFFDTCKASKDEYECRTFLEMEMLKSMKRRLSKK